ncbi:galactose oxidase [Ascodesmis nigricans]|uniref:Galactose oxidase n=1 Tax=Ascodesmis nigricans TaxID=341454 RepID=A0A4S2MSF1_9PEZI|nr:galactose oxidase [Ascodesmis nigricans]
MGKKDKKTKAAEKRLRVAEKTARKSTQKEKKAAKKGGQKEVQIDADDQDIDAVLEEYARKQAEFIKVTETALPEAPPVRSGATLTPSPTTSELYLFGGETFNGSIAHFFNDLCVFSTQNHTWRSISSPNAPLPRSGHWVTSTAHSGGTLWLFGGEFSSPKQNTFHHYHDFWSFSIKTREWTRIEVKGKTPPARSGHRLVAWKNFIVLYGGFQDTSMNTKYLGDLWVFDTDTYSWTLVNLASHAQRPDPRSSFSFLPIDSGAVLYGGYSKQKLTTSSSTHGRKSAPTKNTATEVGVIHDDTWILRLDTDTTKIRWERRKKPTNAPNPKRVGVTMAHHKGRGIMFGGVWDANETDESLESVFFNDLFAWSTDRNRFFPLVLRKPKQQQKRGNNAADAQRGGRRDRVREGEEELLRNLARLEAEALGKTADEFEAAEQAAREKEEEERRAMLEKRELSLELPSPRFHTALAVLDDVLYIYGGTVEKGDREIVYDEMHAVDLGRLDGVRTVFQRKVEADWVDSESEDDGEDDDEDDEDDDDEDDDEAEPEPVEDKKPKISEEELQRLREEKAKKKEASAAAAAALDLPPGLDPPTALTAPTPSPRPFETLRDFFSRTSSEWQNHIIALWEFNDVISRERQEPKTVKEIRGDAFKKAEAKWWDCREEMRELEDEMEESGAGEVVSLEEKAKAAGGVKRR